MFFLKKVIFKLMELGLGLRTCFSLETKDPIFVNFKLSPAEIESVKALLPPGFVLKPIRFTEDEEIRKTRFIFLDVDHDGLYEDKFYSFLNSIEWKGILVLDDIHLNEPMKNFWNGISQEKYDLTQIGHWSGTGLVVFR